MSDRTKMLSAVAALLGIGTFVSAMIDRRAIKKMQECEEEAIASEVCDPTEIQI